MNNIKGFLHRKKAINGSPVNGPSFFIPANSALHSVISYRISFRTKVIILR